MKRINVCVSDETLKAFEWLKIEKGMSKVSAVRLGIKNLAEGADYKDIEIKSKVKVPREVKEEMAQMIANDDLCPVCGGCPLSRCDCARNGALLKKLMLLNQV